MNNPAAKNETIVKYLLGSLPDAETERLDELSLTDDEFALELSATEKDLVDAYVQGELAGATLENFRAYYLASPLRRERVDLAQALGTMAEKHSRAQGESPAEEFAAARPTKRSGWFPLKGFFVTPRLAWQWGFAVAAILFLVAGSWLLAENARLRQQLSQTQPSPSGSGTREQELQNELERQRQAVAKTEQELALVRSEHERLAGELKKQSPESQVAAGQQNATNQQSPRLSVATFILTPQLRSVQQLKTISIPEDTDRISMQLELEPNDFSAYRVALINQAGNQTFWRSRQIKASATSRGKALHVTFPASLLRTQTYALRVTGVAAAAGSEVVGDYPFKVVKQ